MTDTTHRGGDGTARDESTGVEVLIDRLRQQGIDAGKAAAADIVANAERQSEEILREARAKAEALVADAAREAGQSRASGEDALRGAMRDTVLQLRETLRERLESQVRHLASKQLVDEDFVRQLILEIAGRARDDAGVDAEEELEVLLPREILGLEELQRRPEEMESRLSQFAKEIATATWREGISVGAMESGARGIRVRLTDAELELDLTDRAIAALLLRHLQPRFRVIMEGIVW
jgi:V/A-type H+-transporting ATPase subunit E